MSYLVFDPHYPSVIREIRCAVCETVVASLVPLDVICDQFVTQDAGKTIITIRQLSALAYNEHYGGTRTWTDEEDGGVSLPVCRACSSKVLSYEELAAMFDRVGDSVAQLAAYNMANRTDVDLFRIRAQQVRGMMARGTSPGGEYAAS